MRAFSVAFVAFVAFVVLACGTTEHSGLPDAAVCTSGATEPCSGTNGCSGTHTCLRGVFGQCRCLSTDSGVDAADDTSSCQPDTTPFTPKWVPSNMLSVCTGMEVDAAYTACAAPNHTTQQCNMFTSANAACVACLLTPFQSTSYGAVMTWNNGGSITSNRAGCIALIDGDSSPTSCAAKVQALRTCEIQSCLVCPGGFLDCSSIADQTVCSMFTGTQCGIAGKYAACNGPTLDVAFKSLGRLYCAGGAADAGTD